MRTMLMVFVLLSVGCDGGSLTTDEGKPLDTGVVNLGDADGDGVTAVDGDCDDDNPDIHPGRVEACNAIDDNCNGLVDEGHPDLDQDGVADCQDFEECDGLDNDGDGEVDEGYADSDGDGVADCVGEERCDGQDNNGDGQVDEGFDLDGDGVTTCNGDCDDNDSAVFPAAEEVDGDGIDNDCDGVVDETAWEIGVLQIVEVMANPDRVTDRKGEWFEVYNASTTTQSLNGLVIVSEGAGESHLVTWATVLTVEPGAYFVFGNEQNQSDNGGLSVDYEYADISLGNESDQIQIVGEGLVVAALAWDNGLTMPDTAGASMSLDPVGYGAGVVGTSDQWCASVQRWAATSDMGTPGAGNEGCSTWDHDGDGISIDEGDCDDADPSAWPGAPEVDGTIDNDCDGEVETMPVAVASENSGATLEHCTEITLDGTGSSDPDGNAVTYDWRLSSAPVNSAATTADILQTTDAQPVFQADVAGTYVMELTVTDSGAPSYPDTLNLAVQPRATNSEPDPDAGTDQSTSASSSCTTSNYTWTCRDCDSVEFVLDGSLSSDVDNERLAWQWEVLSSDGTATLDDASLEGPTVTLSGPATEYGVTTSETTTLGLRVTDCYGATSSIQDTVVLTYSCTGN